jgi:hypothetical protein
MCIMCRSTRLKIKRAIGMERLVVLFTQKRKYRCADCGYAFRTADRRLVPRESDRFAAERLSGNLP